LAYKLLSIEGTGAYGTVVKARDLDHDRRIVALKVLREDHLDNPRVLCRTRDEARMLGLIDHPGVVKVYLLDERWQRPVMVMEWLEAYSLGDLIDTLGTGLPPDISCETMAQAADALHAAYNTLHGDPPRPLRLVHRDLKPNNMLMTITGSIKLVDFGLAHGDFDGKESNTVSMVLGTRAYMAPERLDGAEDHPSADVYALGLILYELLYGRAMSLSLNPKHHADRLAQKLTQLDLSALPEPSSRRLVRLLSRMLDYEPELRPAHAEVATELRLVMATAHLSPDVHAFARTHVKPLVAARRTVPAEEHEDWEDIRFLEKPPLIIPKLAAPTLGLDEELAAEKDEQIRKLLAGDRWTTHLPRLRVVLEDRTWTPKPFLEVLDEALEHRWSRTPPDPRKLAMCLNLLRQRPTAEVLRRVSALCTYEDDLVATTARQYLDQARPARP
jgi:serine/threonine protein kinase